MEYKVVPFNAAIAQTQGVDVAAEQLESLLIVMAASGWEYVRIETIPTYITGNDGCLGIGATPATTRNYTVVVFTK